MSHAGVDFPVQCKESDSAMQRKQFLITNFFSRKIQETS